MREFTIGGAFQHVAVRRLGSLDRIYVPGWCVRIGPSETMLGLWRGHGWAPPPWGIQVFWKARDVVEQGEELWQRRWSFTLQSPVRFYFAPNLCPSRAWTGRERELVQVQWWTPRGWRACRVGRS